MERFVTRTEDLHNEQQRQELNALVGRAVRIVGITGRFGFVVRGEEEDVLTTVPTRPLYEQPTEGYYRGILEGVNDRSGVRVCVNEAGNFFDFPIRSVSHLAIAEEET